MKFYRLSIDEGKRKKYACAFPAFGYPTEEISCNICGRKWNSFKNVYEQHLSYPIVFTNDNFTDFVWCEFDCMVSHEVKVWFEEMNIKNVRFVEMPVVSKSEMDSAYIKQLRDKGYTTNNLHDYKPRYYRLGSYIGANLHVDAKIVWVNSGDNVCSHCGYGVGYQPLEYFVPDCISLDSWDGSDLFKVQEYMGALFCSDKLKQLIEEKGFKGILFKEVQVK